MAQQAAIAVRNVRKSFGPLRAVDDISLEILEGEIFGIIGPNGAGKTTLVNMITGMMAPDSGSVTTLGLDPTRNERALREVLGVQFQEAQLPDAITVREALVLYSSFYRDPHPWSQLAGEWGITDKLDTRFGNLSGGQKQRLFICLALINRPKAVVLDELTTGLDPNARRMSWDLVEQIRARGTTVVLVTHFMDEAEYLCDRIALIDHGNIVAIGTVRELTGSTGAQRTVTFSLPNAFDPSSLNAYGDVSILHGVVSVTGGEFLMADVAGALRDQKIDPADLTSTTTSLDDIFVRLTAGSEQLA